MGNWLIDTTPIIAIKYDLKREALVGDARLGLLGLAADNSYISLISGGVFGYLPSKSPNPTTGVITRVFYVLLLTPVSEIICKRTVALQMGGKVYKKNGETPDDGSTPSQWAFFTSWVGTEDAIVL